MRPALQIEEEELHRYGYSFVKKVDIWNYWIEKKWKHSKDLMLSDIVSDVFHTDAVDLEVYLKSSKERTKSFDDNVEII